MANDTRLNIVVDNSQAIPAIEETGKAVEDLKNKSKGSTKETKKDWGGVADLFSSVLPRSLTKSIRSFKSTGRQVGRLSRSFKFLKTSIASTGIGLLVIGLGEVVAHWESIMDYMNGVTEETKRLQKLDKDRKETQDRIVVANKAHLETLKDIESTDEQRNFALKEMAKEMGVLKDLDLSSLDAQKQITQAYEDHVKLADTLVLQASKEEELAKALNVQKADGFRLTEEERDLAIFLSNDAASRGTELAYSQAQTKIAEIQAEARLRTRIEDQAEIERIISEQQGISDDILDIENRINATLERQANDRKEAADAARIAAQEQADAERKAAAEKARRAALAESNAKFLVQLEKDLNEQILLAGIEGEQARAEKVLELRHKEGLEKARIAGATAEQLLLIEEGYELDLAALQARFKDDLPDPQDIIDDQEALREELRRADLQENEKDVQQAQDLFDERMELAHGDRELEKQAEELFESEIAEIQDKWTKIANDKADAQRDKEIADAIAIRRAKVSQFEKVGSAANMLFSAMRDAADENSEADKALAITSILISQAVSIAKAIEAAVKVSAKSANPNPFLFAANIAIMVGSVLKAFQGVKNILNQANTSAGLVGNAGVNAGGPTVPLIPLGRLGSPDTNNQAYVVQSQLEGQNLNAEQIRQQTVL